MHHEEEDPAPRVVHARTHARTHATDFLHLCHLLTYHTSLSGHVELSARATGSASGLVLTSVALAHNSQLRPRLFLCHCMEERAHTLARTCGIVHERETDLASLPRHLPRGTVRRCRPHTCTRTMHAGCLDAHKPHLTLPQPEQANVATETQLDHGEAIDCLPVPCLPHHDQLTLTLCCPQTRQGKPEVESRGHPRTFFRFCRRLFPPPPFKQRVRIGTQSTSWRLPVKYHRPVRPLVGWQTGAPGLCTSALCHRHPIPSNRRTRASTEQRAGTFPRCRLNGPIHTRGTRVAEVGGWPGPCTTRRARHSLAGWP
ncbi:hypothetical protein B0T11DRAFT_19376 [Plectosphaerella cucumerina]|uniref:Uncharacterized protein n=1 Tax=Plectosphaerella cucumerina TaxID=40658 RepID=A0A8K0TTD2_9PEZI|nr:hypothetical protein B0T11DRAFT_19376 [Plectosphaerella cucumerina]